MRLSRFSRAALLCATLGALAPLSHATTSQLMTRLYTEALGRAPDATAWRANGLMHGNQLDCGALDFYSIINNIYSSPEYEALHYINEEKVLTLYRGILNREPDSALALRYFASLLESGQPMSTLVGYFVETAEFHNLRDTQICAPVVDGENSPYRWGIQAAIPIGPFVTGLTDDELKRLYPGAVNAGESAALVGLREPGVTASELQRMLDAAAVGPEKVVALPQRIVVYLDRTITIPAGVVLTTAGEYLLRPNQYARMARLVRATAFPGSMVEMLGGATESDPGSTLSNIWLSGQRDQLVNGVTLGYTRGAATVLIRSGSNTSVRNSRFDSPIGGTTIGVEGAEPERLACHHAVVQGNLLTGYSNTHYPVGDLPFPYTDGITIKCADAMVTDNTVIDASDVAIIQFYSAGSQPVQSSLVSSNTVVASGVSAFAAFMFEPYYYNEQEPAVLRDFSGASFDGNHFWSAPGAHFEIGAAIGGNAWHGGYANPSTGGKFINNSNAGIGTSMQVGMGVAGMNNAIVRANQLNYVSYATGRCATRSALVADTSGAGQSTPDLISDNTQNGAPLAYTPGEMDSCGF